MAYSSHQQTKKPKALHPPQPTFPSPERDSGVDLSKVRTFAACRSCRTKKIKCLPGPSYPSSLEATTHGHPPPCQQCTQTGTECTYPPTRDRAAYSRQYVQNLEGRVQALELMQVRMMPLLETYERERGSSVGHDGLSSLPVLQHVDLVVEENDTNPGPSDDDAGQITQDERGNYRWIGSSNTLSLIDSFTHPHHRSPHEPTPPISSGHDTPSNPHRNPYFGAVAGAGVVKALPGIDEVSFPSLRHSREMVDAFFREVHPVLPVVVEHDFREGFEDLMSRKAKGQPERPGGFISVVFAIFALGERVIMTSRAWSRERSRIQAGGKVHLEETVQPGEAEAGVIWYERAQILHYSTLKDVNIYQVQCLTLLAAFQASVNAMPMSWLLAGQAIRVAQDLGLHRSTARMGISFAEKQIRSRCWWSIYGLERLVSVTLGRPLGVDDLDIDVALPADIDDEALSQIPKTRSDSVDLPDSPADSTMSGFVSMTKLCKIAGRVAQVMYRPSNGRSVSDVGWAASQQSQINKLDKLLKDWLATDVSSKYKDPSTAAYAVQLVSATLSNAYFSVLLTLHRNFLPSSSDYPRPRPPSNSQSLSHLVETARSVIHVAAQQRVLLPPSHHLAAYSLSLWSSAVILLLCEVQAKDKIVIDAVGSSVQSCRQSLQALEPAWPGSRKLKDLLNEAELRAKEVSMTAGFTRPKKRKSTSDDVALHMKRSTSKPIMGPSLPSGPPSASWSYSSLPSAELARPRAYETSDTRTIVEVEQPVLPHYQSYSTNTASDPAQNLSFNLDTSLFDVSGMNFDGLEMLQGFANSDTTSFWNSFISPTGQANYVVSGQSTPGSGPSPGSWVVNVNTHGQGAGMSAAGSAGMTGAPSGSSANGVDFWSQVDPGGFDWVADPNVPFNI